MREYVSDIINDEYKQWSRGDSIFIDCQTGQGKTYFILNVYAQYLFEKNKKMLILTNRTELFKEVKSNRRTSNVEVLTYQRFQECIANEEDIEFYDCIVCDECHYFISDAWNYKTDIAWRYIKQLESIKVFMSATGEIAFKLFKLEDSYKYFINRDYNYIDRIYFYEEDNYVSKILSQIPKDEKAIYFSNSVKKAHNTFLQFRDESSFICSKGQSSIYTTDISINAIQNESFNSKYLMATKVIDNGINLKDKKIKHIICDIVDLVTVIQCIGRRRIDFEDANDKITLYIRNYKRSELNRFRNYLVSDIKSADAYLFNKEENKLSREQKNIPKLCYVDSKTNELKVLMLYYTLAKKSCNELEKMMEEGYDKTLLNMIPVSSEQVFYFRDIEDQNRKQNIEQELKRLEENEIRLFNKEKEELIGKFNIYDDRNRQLKSISKLNEYLISVQSEYEIVAKKSNGSSYWMITKKQK